MTCEFCRERLTDFIEGELPPDVEDQVRAHLAECEECARELSQLRAVVSAIHALPEVAPPAELRQRLRRIPTTAAREPERRPAWRRVRYVVASVAAAAAALLLIWAGTTVFQGDGTIGDFGPRARETMAEEPPPPAGEVAEEVVVPPEAPAVEEEGLALEETVAEEAPAAEMEDAGDLLREVTEEAPPPEAEVEEQPPAAPPARPGGGGAGVGATERDREAPRETGETPRVSSMREPSVALPPPPVEAEAEGAPDTEPASDALVPSPGATEMREEAAEEDADRAEMLRAVGPAGPRGAVSTMGMAPGRTLAAPQPKYLEAGADGVAVAEPEEGSPFTVSITPPSEKTTGRIVPATIAVETEKDVARAQITVSGSDELDLVGVRGDRVLFDGPLMAGQETVLSVRMLARDAGRQVLNMRLQSTDPVVDTELAVSMGRFTEPVPPRERPVSFAFEGTPIREAVAELVRQSGVRVHVDNAVSGARVSIATEDEIPAEAALRSIAEAAGLQMRVSEDALYVEPAEP